MTKLFALLLLAGWSLAAQTTLGQTAQLSSTIDLSAATITKPFTVVTGTPGACSNASAFEWSTTTTTLYACYSGTWHALGGSGILPSLANNNIWIGNGSSVATASPLAAPSTLQNYASYKFAGSGAPGTITGNSPGDSYFDTTNSIAYNCLKPFGTAQPACTGVGAGNWVAGGGTSSTTWQLSGSTVVTGSAYNVIPGSGILYPCTNVSGTFTCIPALDTSIGATNAAVANGTNQSVLLTDATSGTWLGTISALAAYTNVQFFGVQFAGNSCVGSDTINLSGIGPLPLYKLVSGAATAVAANDCKQNQSYMISYSATGGPSGVAGYLLLGSSASSGGSAFPITVSGTVNSGGIPYFNSTTQESSSALLTTNVLIKGGGAGGAPSSSLFTDNGTTATYTGTGGIAATGGPLSTGASPPACTAGTAGAFCGTEGTQPTNVAGAATLAPDGTAHQFLMQMNGSAVKQAVVGSMPSPISLTAQTAAITTATLCAASAGACNVAGLYRAAFYLDSTVTCSVAGPGAVGLSITFTDETGTKSAQTVPLDVNGGTTLGSTLALGTTTGNATGTTAFWSTGASAIQYAVSYTACTTGTGTYAIRAAVERLF